MLERLIKWVSGSFDCIKCGKRIQLLFFGFGETLCPDCYQGEITFIFPDREYLLSRLLLTFVNGKEFFKKREAYDDIMIDHLSRIEDHEIRY